MNRAGLFTGLRWLALTLVGLVLTLSLALTAGVLWLRSASGEDWLRHEAVGQLNALLRAEGLQISVDALQGPLPERLQVRGLVVQDAQGPWLTVGDVEVRLNLAALLQPAVLAPLVAVSDAHLLRLPELPPSPPSTGAFPGDLLTWYPPWLRFIRVDAVRVERLSLPAELLGLSAQAREIGNTSKAVMLSADGAVSVPDAHEIRTTLAVHRVDSVAETLTLDATLHPASGQLRLAVRFQEGEGGLVASFFKEQVESAGVPLPAALDLTLTGNAPLTDWHGELSLTATGLLKTQGRVGLAFANESTPLANESTSRATVVRVDLQTEPEPQILETAQTLQILESWRALGPVSLNAEARIDSDAVAVPELRLACGAGDLVVEGVRVGLQEAGVVAGTLRLNLTRPQELAALFGEPSLSQSLSLATAEVTLNAAGTRKAPDVRLLVELHGLRTSANVTSAERFAAERFTAEHLVAEASLTGTLVQPDVQLRISSPALSASGKAFQKLDASLHLRGEAVDVDNPLASSGTATLAVTVTTPHGPARLQAEAALHEAQLTLSKIQLAGLGLGVDGGVTLPLTPASRTARQGAKGTLTARVNDWAAFSALLPVSARAANAEARLSLTPDSGQSADLSWDIQGLQVAGGAEIGADSTNVASLSGRVQGRNLLAEPRLTLTATVGSGSAGKAHWEGAALKFSGDAARKTATFSTSLDSLVYARVGAAYPIMVAVSGSLANQQTLACTVSISGLGLDPLEGRVNLPVRFVDGLPEIPPAGSLSGELRWKGALASVWRLVPLANTRVRGDAVMDVKLGGTVAAPRPSGVIRLDKVLFQDLAQAFEVSNIMAEIVLQANGSGKALVQGTDGRKGTFQLSGTVGPAEAGFPLDIQGSIDRLMPLQRRDVRLSLSGTARVTGTAAAPDVAADITVNGGELLLEQLPSGGIETLDVVAGVPAGARAGVPAGAVADPAKDTVVPAKSQASQPVPAIEPLPAVGRLAVTIAVPNRFYVRGHGIESEWKGQLRVTGPLTNPAVAGELSSMRGTLSFLGKTFVLRRGSVAFDGGTPPRPLLDIQVSYAQQGFTALITLTGPATRPRLKLSSQPSLPTDEIVAQILFGRPTGGLARGEALQLAATVASLTMFGQGGGLMDLTRSAFGLDVLRLGSSRPNNGSLGLTNSAFDAPGSQSISASDASEDDLTLEVGKYVLDNVYVGLEQGMDSRSTGVVVDIEVSPSLNLEARTNGKGSDVEATWSWDY